MQCTTCRGRATCQREKAERCHTTLDCDQPSTRSSASGHGRAALEMPRSARPRFEARCTQDTHTHTRAPSLPRTTGQRELQQAEVARAIATKRCSKLTVQPTASLGGKHAPCSSKKGAHIPGATPLLADDAAVDRIPRPQRRRRRVASGLEVKTSSLSSTSTHRSKQRPSYSSPCRWDVSGMHGRGRLRRLATDLLDGEALCVRCARRRILSLRAMRIQRDLMTRQPH